MKNGASDEMLYQVSCDMAFDDKMERDEIHAYLSSKWSSAFTMKDAGSGDYISPDSISYAASETEPPYILMALLRLKTKSERDEIYTVLKTFGPAGPKDVGSSLITDTAGFIETHTCGHDQNAPCVDTIREEFGISL